MNENENFISFWIVCLRILSSFYCINYGENIFQKDDLEAYIKEELHKSLNNNYEIYSSWLNIILNEVPKRSPCTKNKNIL